MVSDDNFVRVYGNKNNSEVKKGCRNLSMLKKASSILSIIFLCLWALTVVVTFKRAYKEYYVYSIVFILVPFLFTVISNFYISKKLKAINREYIRLIGKILIITALIFQLIKPDILLQIAAKPSTNTNESVEVSTNPSQSLKLSKNYNILVARVNDNDYSSYWRNSIIEENYDNNKIINSVEIISFNKDTLEITTTVIPTSMQVKYPSKDYVDELAYAFRLGAEKNLKEIIEGNFNVKLDELILLNNAETEDLINNYIKDTDITFTEEGLKAVINDKKVNINSLYNPSKDDINNMFSLTKEIFYQIYSKDKSEFKAIKKKLLKLTNKKELGFLDDSYLVYNKLINGQGKINNIQNKINTKEILFSSFLETQNIENVNIPYLDSYKLNVYSEKILKDNIFIKAILEKKLNGNDEVNDTSNDANIDYEENISIQEDYNSRNSANTSTSNNTSNTNNTTSNSTTSNNNNSSNTNNTTTNNSTSNESREDTTTTPNKPSNEGEDTDTSASENPSDGGGDTTSKQEEATNEDTTTAPEDVSPEGDGSTEVQNDNLLNRDNR